MKKGVRIFITASGNTTVSSNFHILFKISKIALMKASTEVNFQETIDTWNRVLLNISCHIFVCYVHIQLLTWTILMELSLIRRTCLIWKIYTELTARPGYSYTVPCMTDDVFCYINTIQVDSALHTNWLTCSKGIILTNHRALIKSQKLKMLTHVEAKNDELTTDSEVYSWYAFNIHTGNNAMSCPG